MYLNKVIIAGNLTRDPELRALPSGTQVAQFGVATNRVWRDSSGGKREETEFHNIVVFGKQADTCSQYLKKGDGVLVEGKLQTRSWESEGQKKYKTEIVAEHVQFGSKSGNKKEDDAEAKADAEFDKLVEETEGIDPNSIPF